MWLGGHPPHNLPCYFAQLSTLVEGNIPCKRGRPARWPCLQATKVKAAALPVCGGLRGDL